MKKSILVSLAVTAALIVCNFPMAAQPPQMERGRQTPTAEQRAAQQSGIFRRELNLTGKQYKKVYRLYLKKFEKMYPEMSGNMPQGPGDGRPGEGRPGEGRPGNGPGGGPPPGGRPAYNAVGQPGAGARGPSVTEPEKDKDIAARRKKMEKVLDQGQFRKWTVMERELLERERMMFGTGDRGGRPEGPVRHDGGRNGRR